MTVPVWDKMYPFENPIAGHGEHLKRRRCQKRTHKTDPPFVTRTNPPEHRYDQSTMEVSLLVGSTVLVEVIFFLVFRFYLVPRANKIERSYLIPYRDYPPEKRIQLLLRILNRIEESSSEGNTREALRRFLLQWFQLTEDLPSVALSSTSSSIDLSRSSSFSEDDETPSPDSDEVLQAPSLPSVLPSPQWTIEGLGKDQVDSFFAWAFFGKNCNDLDHWEQTLLGDFHQVLLKREGLVFHPISKSCKYTPRRLSLEEVNPIHRPLLVYLAILSVQLFAGFVLRICGFRRVESTNGLKGWFRPTKDSKNSFRPLLFFHGIAPAGISFYIPLILHLAGNDERPVLLFENPNISCSIGFTALSEDATMEGIHEIVNSTIGKTADLTLCGHSFGSCQLTWMLHCTLFRQRIKHVLLLDPVTILLSEPDVMNNFLYSYSMSKIRMVASSELFTEYYLRRHFSWYNSELWMESIPDDVKVTVALAEKDEIVNAPKVYGYLQKYERVQKIYWNGVGHANCVTSPSRWNDVRRHLLQGEL